MDHLGRPPDSSMTILLALPPPWALISQIMSALQNPWPEPTMAARQIVLIVLLGWIGSGVYPKVPGFRL